MKINLSYKTLIQLQKDKLESKIMLDMYGQEGHDPRYVDLSMLFYKKIQEEEEKNNLSNHAFI